ncbi:MAG TPA: MmcQ/YjbR family DNA-binding protein [Acidimicrobiales bacterium]|nr:MmcQ/YjbR family DNA-binding protein [Acidimicrobiales bacterium]
MNEDTGPPTAAHAKAEERLRQFALAYPEATEEFPWGERAIKVRGKTFLFMRTDGDGLGLSTKLPESRDFALTYEFASPTGYGLGKSGWVSARFPRGTRPPVALLCEWIDESYRAIAPKTLLKQLPA